MLYVGNVSESSETLRKKYRIVEDDQAAQFDNVNVVVPGLIHQPFCCKNDCILGRFNPNYPPNGVTQCKKDSSTNGTRVCSSFVPNNCQNGFKIGGNCNSQQRLDNTKLPQSEFQMGEEQVSHKS